MWPLVGNITPTPDHNHLCLDLDSGFGRRNMKGPLQALLLSAALVALHDFNLLPGSVSAQQPQITEEMLSRAGIIPDVVPAVGSNPNLSLEIMYPFEKVNAGNLLTMNSTADTPTVTISRMSGGCICQDCFLACHQAGHVRTHVLAYELSCHQRRNCMQMKSACFEWQALYHHFRQLRNREINCMERMRTGYLLTADYPKHCSVCIYDVFTIRHLPPFHIVKHQKWVLCGYQGNAAQRMKPITPC